MSWLDYCILTGAEANQLAAGHLPAANTIGGNVAVSIESEDGSPLVLYGLVVGVSFTAEKVRYAVAFAVSPEPRDGLTLYAVVGGIPSELVSPNDAGTRDGVSEDAFALLERAAHDGAFGDNNLPLPTPAQCLANDYKVGHTEMFGLPVAIEQPRGSVRSGVDPDGHEWSNRMAAHYGYIEGTTGADGDEVDCFIGPVPESTRVYVINQVDPRSGRFDEHKTMLGFADRSSAIQAYQESYDRDWRGLGSIVSLTVAQLKQWLAGGDTTQELTAAQLPEGATMDKVTWAGDMPENKTLDAVLYDIRRHDDGAGLVFDPVTEDEIHQDAEEVMTLDAMVVPFKLLQRRMGLLQNVMNRTGTGLNVAAYTITKPYKIRGVVNVAAIFEMSDGQTMTIYFHSGNQASVSRVQPNDELISWKWLLNKKDITIVVARERGADLNVREVSRRVMRLADKNSAAFKKVNASRAARLESIEGLKAQISDREQTLETVQRAIVEKRAEKERADAEARAAAAAIKLDPAETGVLRAMGVPEADVGAIQLYATYAAFAADIANQDVADHIAVERINAIRNGLRERGWEGLMYGQLTKTVGPVVYGFGIDRRSASSYNLTNFAIAVGRTGEDGRESHVGTVENDMTKTADQLAHSIDAMAAAVASPIVEPAAAQPAEPDAAVVVVDPTIAAVVIDPPTEPQVALDPTPEPEVVATVVALPEPAAEPAYTLELNGAPATDASNSWPGLSLADVTARVAEISNDVWWMYKVFREDESGPVDVTDEIRASAVPAPQIDPALPAEEAPSGPAVVEVQESGIAAPEAAALAVQVAAAAVQVDPDNPTPPAEPPVIPEPPADPTLPAGAGGQPAPEPTAVAEPPVDPQSAETAPLAATAQTVEPSTEPAASGEPPAVPEVPTEPVVAEGAQLPAAIDRNRDDDIAFIQSVIDQSADMMDPEVPEKLATIHAAYGDDAGMGARFSEAVRAYSSFMVDRAGLALA
ncbi:hypothetical protein [Cupriavidus basilensis]|uniref:Phage protein n=1 Tax=Cupriavidus basilensis TaxID=68895 RepID=A0A0C4Y720_9BURK|nr:hypothetical protein [Cupriavidus basilensis]AJG18830.1 Phage protein [Cupriavidus basilensis]